MRAGSSSSLYSEDSDDSSVSGISALSGVSGASSVSGGPNINGKNEDLFDSAELGSGKKRIGAKRGSSVPRKSYKKSGKITFTTEYSTDTKTLEVHILRVFDLISRKQLNEINPFVNVFLHPGKHQKYSTKYHKGTRNPYINEKVFFKDIEKDSFNRYKLRFRVYHYSRVKTKELLGELEVALSSLDTNVKETFNVDLFIMNQQKVSQLEYFITFTLKYCFYLNRKFVLDIIWEKGSFILCVRKTFQNTNVFYPLIHTYIKVFRKICLLTK